MRQASLGSRITDAKCIKSGYSAIRMTTDSKTSSKAKRSDDDRLKLRSIMHVDMDAFYAAVEQLDNPKLKGRPVIVGGLGMRGVVSTASYEARRFGVHSAMPMARARVLCRHAHFIRPRMARYKEISREFFEIFHWFTQEVEGLSMDEAFLDISGDLTDKSKRDDELRETGRGLQQAIYANTGLTASVGMAHNKLLAKLGSDYRKPRGRTFVGYDKVHLFLDPLPLGRLWGIGKQTLPRLQQAGLLTIGQLRRASPEVLETLLGQRWQHYYLLAQGIDHRLVKVERADKSISRETTFSHDMSEQEPLLETLHMHAAEVAQRAAKKSLLGRTISIKLRDRNFATISRSRTLAQGINTTEEIFAQARQLFEEWCESSGFPAVRLIGVGISNLGAVEDQPIEELL